jgi:tetratricopeptide (TPR) repeat protein
MTTDFDEGMRLRHMHRWKAAVAAFERAVIAEPDRPEAHFWLAVTLDNRGQEEAAIPAYRRALELGLPDDLRMKALTWLASSLSKTGRHYEAIEALKTAQQAGGYEPRSEFESIHQSVLRRSRPKASIASPKIPVWPEAVD